MHRTPTLRLIQATLLALALTFICATAMAQRVGYRLQNRVALGDKPQVVLQPGEDIQAMEIIIKRKDGPTQTFRKKNLKAGAEVSLPINQPEGRFEYEATLKMTTAQGDSEVRFEFDAVVARRVTVSVVKDACDLAAGKITLLVDGAVTHADLVVAGESGVIAERQVELGHVTPGVPFELTWQGEGEARQIDVKVHDPAGFWTGLQLVPFSVDIPHEEVNFDSGKSTFQPSEARKLDDTLKLIQAEVAKYGKDLEINLYIVGYTDTVGARESNIGLSQARARAIGAYFRQKGLKIPVYYQGFGEDVLAVQTGDNVDEPRNRRAVYVLGNLAPPRSGQIPKGEWKRLQ